ncbi:MAG: prepilin-type N-terminal cleavage/methylation domain-containing protein [Gammaproteobacteria bacterium]
MVAKLKKHQSGFTLVEIAIVLVIIGLLLGGILKGQELITSARVRNLADQNSGVQAAYYGFIDRYRQVPGDMSTANATAAIGANNIPATRGADTGNTGNGRLDVGDWNEAANVWVDLSAAGFINGRYNGGANTEATYAVALIAPVNAFNGSIALTRGAQYQVTAPEVASPRQLFFTGRQIPVNVMRELDVKIDDGQPTRGVLRATPAGAGQVTASDAVTACVNAAGIWDINANSADCGAAYLY